jgi:hypothetical protein
VNNFVSHGISSYVFEAVSRLTINLFKSEIVPVGNVGDVEGLANIMGVEWLRCR